MWLTACCLQHVYSYFCPSYWLAFTTDSGGVAWTRQATEDCCMPDELSTTLISSLPMSTTARAPLSCSHQHILLWLVWPRCFSWKQYYHDAIHLTQWFSTLSACKNHWWSLKNNHLYLAPPPPPPGSALLVLGWDWSWLHFKSLFRWS